MRAENRRFWIRAAILGALGAGAFIGTASYLANKADKDYQEALLRALQAQDSSSLPVDAWQTQIVTSTPTPIR